MTRLKPSNVERLLVYPGHDCACCVGRFGFEHGLRELSESRPRRTRKKILRLNPLFIRQLPSFRHQVVHVETLMRAMGSDLPGLFKKWRKHLQTYPELPYLLHYVLMNSGEGSFGLPPEVTARCKKLSPFKTRRVEGEQATGFSLKKRWTSPAVVQEMLRNLASVVGRPTGYMRDDLAYLPQLTLLLHTQLSTLRQEHDAMLEMQADAEFASNEARHRREEHARSIRLQLDGWYRGLADFVIPQTVRAVTSQADEDTGEACRSILAEFFSAGGSYAESSFNIAALVLEIEPALLIDLDEHRKKLNDVSTRVLENHLEEIRSTLEQRRQDAAIRQAQARAERLRQLEAERARAAEHQQLQAEREERRAAMQAARSEPLADMVQRFSTLDASARMTAVAAQIAYAPSTFPADWAAEFADAHVAELDIETLELLIERTRGVQRGEWKKLHKRLRRFEQERRS